VWIEGDDDVKPKLPYFATKPWIVIALILLGVIASMSPDAPVLELFEGFVQFQSFLFPPIAAYAQQSEFPRVMGTYMAFSYALIPAHFWYSYRHLRDDTGESWHKNLWVINSWLVLFQRLILIVIGIAAVYIGLFLNPGYDFNLLPINTSTTALALGGWLLGGAGQAWCLAWVYVTLTVVLNFFRRKFK
jgi:hypothetical protein